MINVRICAGIQQKFYLHCVSPYQLVYTLCHLCDIYQTAVLYLDICASCKSLGFNKISKLHNWKQILSLGHLSSCNNFKETGVQIVTLSAFQSRHRPGF